MSDFAAVAVAGITDGSSVISENCAVYEGIEPILGTTLSTLNYGKGISKLRVRNSSLYS